MSQIIRDAIIRIKLEQQKTKLEAPDTSAAQRAHQAEAKAARDSAKAIQEKMAATKEHAQAAGRTVSELERQVTHSGYRMVASFREGGEGALRMARGIAFLSASGSESLQKLVAKVALAQGAFDIFAGGTKMLVNLGAAFGPIGMGVAAVTAALVAGVTWWKSWSDAADSARKKAEAAEQSFRRLSQQRMEAANQNRMEAIRGVLERAGMQVGIALTESTRLERIVATQGQLQRARGEQAAREANLRRLLVGTDPTLADPANLVRTAPAHALQLAGYAQRQQELGRAEMELRRQQYEIEKSRADEQRRQQGAAFNVVAAGAAASSAFGGAGIGVAQAGAQLLAENQRRLDELTDSSQKSLEAILNVLNTLGDRANALNEELKKLDAANNGR